MSQIDILDLEYTSRGRDIDIVEPTLSYLEEKYNFKIERKWLFKNYIYDILKYRPKILLIANGIGSHEHFNAVKFASLMGIKVVTFTSEGDYIPDEKSLDSFFWGWNHDKILYEDLHLEWSQRNIDLIKKYIPQEALNNSKVELSGATGFDKYKLLSFLDKKALLKKYNKTNY